MPASSFDFDVITGPSTPREDRGDRSRKTASNRSRPRPQPATPRTR